MFSVCQEVEAVIQRDEGMGKLLQMGETLEVCRENVEGSSTYYLEWPLLCRRRKIVTNTEETLNQLFLIL